MKTGIMPVLLFIYLFSEETLCFCQYWCCLVTGDRVADVGQAELFNHYSSQDWQYVYACSTIVMKKAWHRHYFMSVEYFFFQSPYLKEHDDWNKKFKKIKIKISILHLPLLCWGKNLLGKHSKKFPCECTCICTYVGVCRCAHVRRCLCLPPDRFLLPSFWVGNVEESKMMGICCCCLPMVMSWRRSKTAHDLCSRLQDPVSDDQRPTIIFSCQTPCLASR